MPESTVDQLFSRLEDGQSVPRRCVTQDTGEVKEYKGTKQLVVPVEQLSGQRGGYNAVVHERPEHRIVLWLKAQGHSTKEIAQATGFTEGHVRTVCNQPWFRERVAQVINDLGRDAVKTVLQGEVLPSIELLREVRDDESARKADRISAARELLDRFMGKPTVKVETDNRSTVTNISADRARLEEEARQNEAALRARGVSIVPSKS